MTTPRSPVTTRKLGDTSFEAQGEDGAAKAQKMDSETPSWAQALLKTMNNVEASQTRTEAKLDAMRIRVEKLEVKVAEGEEHQASMGDKLNQLEMENAWLRGTVEGLRVDLDKQIDSDLREHLVFYGIPGNEKTWEESAKRLAKWLGENIEGRTEKEFDDNIWRCHRGPLNPEKGGPRPMFAYLNYRYVDLIQNKMKTGSFGGVRIREQYCANTQARVNDALAFRKSWKAQHPNSKAYIKFPAVVKVQEEGDTSYRVEKSF